MPRIDIKEKLFSYIEKTDTCWIWNGPIGTGGYGMFSTAHHRGYSIRAHRAAYQILVGDIPEGLVIDHLCRVRHCVNPEHLQAVTFNENAKRRSIAYTHCKHGHEYDENNTHVYNGKKYCRMCHKIREKKRRLEKKNSNVRLSLQEM